MAGCENERQMRRALLFFLLAIAWLHAAACPAGRTLSVVVPFPPGGSLDATTRVLADAVAPLMHRPVVIRNVPGASGVIAVREVLSSPSDGCTVLAGTTTAVVLVPLLNPAAGFASTDLRPVAKVGSSELVLIAARSFPPRSISELASYVRSRGTPILAGHPGNESVQAIALDVLRERAGADMVQVAYNGSAHLVSDLLGGHIDIAVVASPAAVPLLRDGRAKIVARLSRQTGYDMDSWSGWFVPATVADAATADLRSALVAVLQDENVQKALLRLGAPTPTADSQDRFPGDIRRTEALYSRMTRSKSRK